MKNISYDSNGKIIPLKLVGSDGDVYQPNTNLLPSGISKDNLLKSRDNVLNTPDSLNEYNKTNQDVKNSFISNLPKDLVGKQITIDENCSKFLNSFLGTSFKENEKFEFTDFVSNLYDVTSQKAFDQEITLNDIANVSTVIGLDLNKEIDSLKNNPNGYVSSFNSLLNSNLNSSTSLKIVGVNRQFGVGASNPSKNLPSTSDVDKNKPSDSDISNSQKTDMSIDEFYNLNQNNENSRYSFSVMYTVIAAISLVLTLIYTISSALTFGSLSLQAGMSVLDTILATTAAGVSWSQYYDLNSGLDDFSNYVSSMGIVDAFVSPNIEWISKIFVNLYNDIFDGTLVILSLPKVSLSAASIVLDVMSGAISLDDLILSNLEKNTLNQ